MADAHEEGAGVARSLQCTRPQTFYPISCAPRAARAQKGCSAHSVS